MAHSRSRNTRPSSRSSVSRSDSSAICQRQRGRRLFCAPQPLVNVLSSLTIGNSLIIPLTFPVAAWRVNVTSSYCGSPVSYCDRSRPEAMIRSGMSDSWLGETFLVAAPLVAVMCTPIVAWAIGVYRIGNCRSCR
jgi:hypothetical protein